jgi:hypothetical protein
MQLILPRSVVFQAAVCKNVQNCGPKSSSSYFRGIMQVTLLYKNA